MRVLVCSSQSCVRLITVVFILKLRYAAFKTIPIATGSEEGSASGDEPMKFKHSGKIIYSYATDRHRSIPRFHGRKILRRMRYFNHRHPKRLGRMYPYDRRSSFRLPYQFREYTPSTGRRHHRYFLRRIRPMIFLPNFRSQPIMTRPLVLYPDGPIPGHLQSQFYGEIPDLFEGKTKHFFLNYPLNRKFHY